jgi:DNA-binding response OmpR family regulator
MAGGRSLTNVLIIDDSAAARASIASTLRLAGYCVFELSSAIGATRTILRNNISAVIVDLGMPGLSGDKLVGLLRSNRRLSNLVVIVVSGQSGAELERIGSECRVDAILEKRDIGGRLVHVLEQLLRASSGTLLRAKAYPDRAEGE